MPCSEDENGFFDPEAIRRLRDLLIPEGGLIREIQERETEDQVRRITAQIETEYKLAETTPFKRSRSELLDLLRNNPEAKAIRDEMSR